MKQPHILLKLAAVVSSLLLGGGFVSYQAGAFDWLRKPNAQPVDSTSDPIPEENVTDGAGQPTPTIFSGSKSLILGGHKYIAEEPPATVQQPPPETSPPTPTIMNGTKRIVIDFRTPSPPAAPPPATPEPSPPSP